MLHLKREGDFMYRTTRTTAILACFLWVLAGSAYAGAKIEFAESEHDFGDIEQGKNGEYFFTFKNVGDEPLKIDRVKTSCGCTASSTEKDLIEPGEEGEIKVVYKSKNRSGAFTQRIRVFTNDPGNPETVLKIRGVVKLGPAPVIAVKKPHVNLGVLHMKNRASFTLLVENTGNEPLEIYSIADYRGVVLFEGTLSIPGGKTKTMDLFYKPQKAGTLRETMFITSNDPRKPRLPIHLNGYVEEKDMITIVRGNDTTFSFQNNTLSAITVTPKKSKRDKQTIEPGKSVEFELAPGESIADIVFSVESTANE
jgi:hypothetical protein